MTFLDPSDLGGKGSGRAVSSRLRAARRASGDRAILMACTADAASEGSDRFSGAVSMDATVESCVDAVACSSSTAFVEAVAAAVVETVRGAFLVSGGAWWVSVSTVGDEVREGTVSSSHTILAVVVASPGGSKLLRRTGREDNGGLSVRGIDDGVVDGAPLLSLLLTLDVFHRSSFRAHTF